MNTNKRLNYFCFGLVLVISLLLWNPFMASFFSQNGGGVKAEGPTMLEISGKVVQTMNGSGYTYALVSNDGVKTCGWPCPRAGSRWVMRSPACRA